MENNHFKKLKGRPENAGIPPILYKYRDWEDEYHKRILTHNEIYFAPPSHFEDELDCRVPIRYDLLSDNEIYDIYYKSSKKSHPNYTRNQRRQYAREWCKKGLLRNKEHLKSTDDEFFKKFNNNVGVLSLTAKSNNIDMWNNYSNCGKGFCIGFNTTLMLNELPNAFGSGMEVSYYDELPIIKFTYSIERGYFLQVYSKLKKYEYEKEYRLTKLGINSRQLSVPSEMFSHIIIGENMPGESKNEIITLATKFKNVTLYTATFDNDKVEIVPLQ